MARSVQKRLPQTQRIPLQGYPHERKLLQSIDLLREYRLELANKDVPAEDAKRLADLAISLGEQLAQAYLTIDLLRSLMPVPARKRGPKRIFPPEFLRAFDTQQAHLKELLKREGKSPEQLGLPYKSWTQAALVHYVLWQIDGGSVHRQKPHIKTFLNHLSRSRKPIPS